MEAVRFKFAVWAAKLGHLGERVVQMKSAGEFISLNDPFLWSPGFNHMTFFQSLRSTLFPFIGLYTRCSLILDFFPAISYF
jgi:hypothetical protein